MGDPGRSWEILGDPGRSWETLKILGVYSLKELRNTVNV